MNNMDIINELKFEFDNSKSIIINTYEFIILFLEKTDREDRLRTRIIQHTLRTMKIAEKILKKEFADRQIVMIALLLHDIGKTLTDSRHDLVSYDIAQIYLKETNLNDDTQKRILDCILYHSAKSIKTIKLTPEQQVVMDADIMDEIGILSVVKCCLKSQRNKDIDEIINQMDVVYNKIERESEYVQTKYGRELYSQKKNKLKELLNLLRSEAMMYKIK